MRVKLWLLVCTLAAPVTGSIPPPAEHFGFTLGEDLKLADFSQISSYFLKLARASDRIRVERFGTSSEGKPLYLAVVSSPENLARLDFYRDISRRLALGLASEEQAGRLAAEGKAIVWIDSGLHASEVAPAQHAPELAYRLVTGETPEIRRILDHVILLQVPVINPDGLDWIVHWYRSNVGTPHELAPLPRLYHKYAGHDNNRDWFMLNLEETRHATRLLYQEWFPQIVYNQHQQPPFPARIFVPPYAEPLNPNIPAPVMAGVHLIGAAIKERLAREGKPGAISYHGFDGWWNGGLRSAPAFHNMHGILTETAAGVYATPVEYKLEELPKRFSNGLPATEPSIFYPYPWRGGRWGVREAIDYMLAADLAILDLAACRSEAFLRKAWEMARAAIEAGQRGSPFAYIVPAGQWDPYSTVELLRRLAAAGVQVHRTTAPVELGGKSYAAGSYVLLAAQPFRAYLIDLLEPQKYPEIRDGAQGELRRPYDVAGWTLSMSMGVDVDRVDAPFTAPLEPVAEAPAAAPSLERRDTGSLIALADLLARGADVRWGDEGRILVRGQGSDADYQRARFALRRPRVGLYESYMATSDTGWTQWLLDTFRVPYRLLHNSEFAGRGLEGLDAIILASQSASAILHGYRPGEPAGSVKASLALKALQRPEYCGGIGLAGALALERFVAAGGTLIAFDQATDLPVQYFPLPVRNVLAAASPRFHSPGSLLRATVDTRHPLAAGMRDTVFVFTTSGRAFESTLAGAREEVPKAVVHYARSELLASGWLSGEAAARGKAILMEVPHGKGRVILFGFRPQFRGQTYGTFKLVLNAIYLASANVL
jgi:hypothetical protein